MSVTYASSAYITSQIVFIFSDIWRLLCISFHLQIWSFCSHFFIWARFPCRELHYMFFPGCAMDMVKTGHKIVNLTLSIGYKAGIKTLRHSSLKFGSKNEWIYSQSKEFIIVNSNCQCYNFTDDGNEALNLKKSFSIHRKPECSIFRVFRNYLSYYVSSFF